MDVVIYFLYISPNFFIIIVILVAVEEVLDFELVLELLVKHLRKLPQFDINIDLVAGVQSFVDDVKVKCLQSRL